MQDPQSVSGAPRTVRIGGESYALYPLTVDDITGPLQTFVDGQFPDPFDVANRQIATGRYNITQQKFLLERAMEQATRSRRLVGSPEATEVLQSMEGTKFVIALSIRKGNPAFTAADADRMYQKMTMVDIQVVNSVTTVDMVFSDPKAETAETTTTPPGTTTA